MNTFLTASNWHTHTHSIDLNGIHVVAELIIILQTQKIAVKEICDFYKPEVNGHTAFCHSTDLYLQANMIHTAQADSG